MRMKFVMILILVFAMVASVQAKTKITWWQFWTDPDIKPTINAMVDEFEKANPDIDVEVTDLTWANGHEKLVIAFASGNGPDIVELGSDWITEFIVNDHLADISKEVADDSDNFDGWSMATWDGKVYAKPWILGTRVLFGNRDLLTKVGYPEEYIPMNWPQLEEMVNKVEYGLGEDIYGWGSNTAEKHRLYKKFMPFFWSNRARVFSDDGRYCLVASEYAVEALKFYKKLHDDAGYVANQRGIEDAFLDGKVGFIISGDWLLKRIKKEDRKINFFTTFIPGPELPGTSFKGGEFLAVNKTSENKEAAMKFIDFITSAENQLRFCKANYSANPSSRFAQEDDFFQNDPNLLMFIKQIKSAKHPPLDPDWVNIEDIIERAVEDCVFKNEPAGDALYDARNEIIKLKKL